MHGGVISNRIESELFFSKSECFSVDRQRATGKIHSIKGTQKSINVRISITMLFNVANTVMTIYRTRPLAHSRRTMTSSVSISIGCP